MHFLIHPMMKERPYTVSSWDVLGCTMYNVHPLQPQDFSPPLRYLSSSRIYSAQCTHLLCSVQSQSNLCTQTKTIISKAVIFVGVLCSWSILQATCSHWFGRQSFPIKFEFCWIFFFFLFFNSFTLITSEWPLTIINIQTCFCKDKKGN